MADELIITDANYKSVLSQALPTQGYGLIPRDYKAYPLGVYPEAVPFTLPLIPEDEWQDRLDERVAARAQLSDIRMVGDHGDPIASLNQGQYPYCWAHSTVTASMIARAVAGSKYHELSAFAVACMVTGYQMRGGWCQESLAWIAKEGVPTTDYWPQQSTSRSNDNPDTWANASLHIAAEWYDLDPRYMKEQMVTCLLSGMAMAGDFNWWGHSVCLLDVTSIRPFRIRILNSWGDGWSHLGMAQLEEYQAIPNGAVAIRVTGASVA